MTGPTRLRATDSIFYAAWLFKIFADFNLLTVVSFDVSFADCF